MIITHLSMIQDMYKRYAHDLFLSSEFGAYFESTLASGDIARLMLVVAYEAKDFGDGIEAYATTDKIREYFEKAFVKLDQKVSAPMITPPEHQSGLKELAIYYLAKAIFEKYFVFATKAEYLKFYKSCKDKGYDSVKIMKIFEESFGSLQRSFQYLYDVQNILSDVLYTDKIMITAAMNKELSESYGLLEALGDPDSYPNIDSSYVYIDQVHDSDFYSTASSLLYQWCVKQ